MIDKLIFDKALETYRSCRQMRDTRRRLKRFVFGNQWGDIEVDSLTGAHTTEGERIYNVTGRRPLTNNLIRRLVKVVVGRFRADREEQTNLPDNLKAIYKNNSLNEIDTRMLEEFLISGCAIQRISHEYGREGSEAEIVVENVSPDNFFVNSIRDPRGNDVEIVGSLRDMSLHEVLLRYAGGDPARAAMIARLYSSEANVMPEFGGLSGEGDLFFRSETGRCRVIEVWTLEFSEVLRVHDVAEGTYTELPLRAYEKISQKKAEREAAGVPSINIRYVSTSAWKCRCFAPNGTLLDSYESPLGSQNHPYAIKLYPLIDGEIHPFVSDLVDLQKRVNRMANTMDNIMATSAKGALLVHERAKLPNMKWVDLGLQWARPGSVIPYTGMPGTPPPTQITTAGVDNNLASMMQMQMTMMNDVAGIGDVLLGRKMSLNTGAESYNAQISNAEIALNDLFATYADFISRRDAMIEKCDLAARNIL